MIFDSYGDLWFIDRNFNTLFTKEYQTIFSRRKSYFNDNSLCYSSVSNCTTYNTVSSDSGAIFRIKKDSNSVELAATVANPFAW